MEKYPVDFVVKATENTKLPPYHFTVVKCCISQHAKTVHHADDILHITPTAKYSNKMDAPLLQDSTVSYHANGKVFLIMANHTPAYHTIKKNTIIRTGSSVKQNNIDIIETCQVTPDANNCNLLLQTAGNWFSPLAMQDAFCLVCWFSCSFVSEACACFGEWL